MQTTRNTILAATLGLLLWTVFLPIASAQLVYPEITVDASRLPEEAQTKLAGIDSLLRVYLEKQEWTRDEYQYDFPVQINIYFTEYNASVQEDKYKANLIATNTQDVRLEDSRWEFGLRQPYVFRANEYQPFKSVVEFYIWILVGMEYDKLEKLGGQTYYDRARGIFLQSSNSVYYFGWDKRSDMLRAQTDESNRTARELSFFYSTAIYYDTLKDYRSSKDYLYYALVKLDKVPIDVQKRFLDINHREFAEALVRAGYPQGVKALMQMDPQRRKTYESIAPEGENK
ncbi:DUF4835 family protein [candidate division KSB1 bacterium]|nr:MAG: DUF4835 family protein [candidate division KSB1 bacterium]